MKFKQKFGWVSHIFGQNWIVPRYQNTGWWVSDLQKSKMQYSRPCVCNLVPDPPLKWSFEMLNDFISSSSAQVIILQEVAKWLKKPAQGENFEFFF